MTLFSMPRTASVLALAAVLAAGGMTAASARDRDREPGFGWSDRSGATRSEGNFIGRSLPREHHGWRPRDRHREAYRAERRREGYRWAGRDWKDRNFYGGTVSTYRDPGNGLYFYIDDDRLPDTPSVAERGPKVITVTPGRNSCSWEAGVCVIRPGY